MDELEDIIRLSSSLNGDKIMVELHSDEKVEQTISFTNNDLQILAKDWTVGVEYNVVSEARIIEVLIDLEREGRANARHVENALSFFHVKLGIEYKHIRFEHTDETLRISTEFNIEKTEFTILQPVFTINMTDDSQTSNLSVPGPVEDIDP